MLGTCPRKISKDQECKSQLYNNEREICKRVFGVSSQEPLKVPICEEKMETINFNCYKYANKKKNLILEEMEQLSRISKEGKNAVLNVILPDILHMTVLVREIILSVR